MYRLDPTQAKRDVEKILTCKISGDYPWLDFKLRYTGNAQDFIHNVLCLSNARHDGARYIIYGVKNKGTLIPLLKNGTEVKAIDKPLTERVEILLAQSNKWQKFSNVVHFENFSDRRIGYFHLDFPEYQIRFSWKDSNKRKSFKDWTERDYFSRRDNLEESEKYSRVARRMNKSATGGDDIAFMCIRHQFSKKATFCGCMKLTVLTQSQQRPAAYIS